MGKQRKLSAEELALFCEQMFLVLDAGIPYDEGLAIIGGDLEPGSVREGVQMLAENLKENSFAQAVAMTPFFPPFMGKMVAIGETAGRLDDVMRSLYRYYSRRDTILQSVKNAVLFPFVMALMMFSVILVLLVKVLPVFYEVLQDLGSGLPGFAGGLLRFGVALGNHLYLVLGIFLLVLFLLILVVATEKGRNMGFRVFRKVCKKIYIGIDLANFSSSMAMLLKSGVTVDEALIMSGEVSEDESLRRKITTVQKQIEAGAAFAQSLAEARVFSHMHIAMITLGVKTGTLDEVMDTLAEYCNAAAEERINKIVSFIEPLIVAVFSLIVAVILLSVILPLMGVLNAL